MNEFSVRALTTHTDHEDLRDSDRSRIRLHTYVVRE